MITSIQSDLQLRQLSIPPPRFFVLYLEVFQMYKRCELTGNPEVNLHNSETATHIEILESVEVIMSFQQQFGDVISAKQNLEDGELCKG